MVQNTKFAVVANRGSGASVFGIDSWDAYESRDPGLILVGAVKVAARN